MDFSYTHIDLIAEEEKIWTLFSDFLPFLGTKNSFRQDIKIKTNVSSIFVLEFFCQFRSIYTAANIPHSMYFVSC
jgi:hypothetical protein